MIHLVGAVLVITACFSAGLKAARQLSADIAVTDRLLRTVPSLRTEVCLRKQPLSSALSLLKNEFIGKEPMGANGIEKTSDRPFSERWCEVVCAMRLPAVAQTAMCRLGEDLSAGEEPEMAFSFCEKSLAELLDALKEKQTREGKTYVAMGLCAGVMLAILFV